MLAASQAAQAVQERSQLRRGPKRQPSYFTIGARRACVICTFRSQQGHPCIAAFNHSAGSECRGDHTVEDSKTTNHRNHHVRRINQPVHGSCDQRGWQAKYHSEIRTMGLRLRRLCDQSCHISGCSHEFQPNSNHTTEGRQEQLIRAALYTHPALEIAPDIEAWSEMKRASVQDVEGNRDRRTQIDCDA
jgi:hypothetical protein